MKGSKGLLIACLAVIAVWVLVFGHPRSGEHYVPASTSGTWAPHNPGVTAAVVGGEARAAGHAARFAGRMAFRGGIMRGFGRGFGTGGFTPGGIGFHGFGFGGF